MIRDVERGAQFSYRRRMGATTSQEIQASTNAAATAVSLSVPVIGPIIGGAMAAVGALVNAFGIGNGCGTSCTQSTQVVNQVIPMMQQNLAAANAQNIANGGCLTADEQTAALSNFDQLWQTIVTQCSAIGGGGGHNCIADRQRGGKYDCFVTLRDPISALMICAETSGATTIPALPGSGLPGSNIPVVTTTQTGMTTLATAPTTPSWLLIAALGLGALVIGKAL